MPAGVTGTLLRLLGIALLALVFAAGSASAQARGQGRGTRSGAGQAQPPAMQGGRQQGPPRAPMGAGPALLQDSLAAGDPIHLLLLRGDSLQLASAQVRALESISAALHHRNAPLIDSLLDMRRDIQPLIGRHPRDMSDQERERFALQAERARPLMAQLHANNVGAMAEVGAILTPAQKVAVRRWLQASGLLESAGYGGPTHEPLRRRLRRGGGGPNGAGL
jgi:hypothetical protein